MSNLARYQISKINEAIQAEQDLKEGIGRTTTADAEMKKEAENKK